jgi:uncharacterized damage-inducible protein DinB
MRHSLICLFAAFPLLAQAPVAKEFLAEFDQAAGHVLQLAEATPDEKYAWRPGPGVRSFSEIYMHLAGGNLMLLGFAGAEKPGVSPRELEKKVTTKAEVVDWLKRSFDSVRKAYSSATPEVLDRPAKFFGRDTTVRAIYLRLLVHVNEHMGQAVAYARVNGIVPPWSKQ